MALIGYGRVSTRDQNPDYQKNALLEAGCSRVFIDHGNSSRDRDRPEWLACLDYLRPADTLVVHRLDRVSGEWHLFRILVDLAEQGIFLKSLTEPVDTSMTAPMSQAFSAFCAVMAQLRVDTIRENTRAGLANARAQGRVGGRPSVITKDREQLAKRMHAEGSNYTAIGKALGVSRTTATKMVQAAG